jgi:hypothetical protein
VNDNTATLRGLTIGAGTDYRWARWPTGLLDTADIRVEDRFRPRRNGVTPGDDFYGERRIVFELELLGDTRDGGEQLATDLAEAFAASATDEWLDVRVTGTPAEYSLRGRPRGAIIALGRRFTGGGNPQARCIFVATDPVRYGAEQSLALTLVDPGEGLEFPVTFPVVFSGGGMGSGTAPAVNDGNTPVDWTATLTGPLTNPRLALVGSGRFVRVLATIAAGETVVLDSAAGAILLGGTAPRPQWFGAGSSWFQLEPGSNSILFTVDAGSGTADITWRPGWA